MAMKLSSIVKREAKGTIKIVVYRFIQGEKGSPSSTQRPWDY